MRWTGTDHERGLVNADRAQLTGIARDALTVTTADGRALRLERGDGERAAATGEDAAWAAERKLERLVERMDEQPALERALDRQIPERQLEIHLSGITRARDMGMGG